MIAMEVKALRGALRVTQATLGLLVGAHACTIGRWERGKHRPRPIFADRLRQIAEAPPAATAPTAPTTARQPVSAARRRAAPRADTIRTLHRPQPAPQPGPQFAPRPTAPTAPTAQAVERGARWQIHTGDLFDVLPTLQEASFDALIVDLPYCSGGLHIGARQQSPRRKYQGHSVQLRYQDFDGDQRDQLSFVVWAHQVLRQCYRLIKRSGVFCVFSDWRQGDALKQAVQVAGFVMRGQSVWDKTGAARPSLSKFRHQAEFVLWGSRGELPPRPGVPVLPGVFSHAIHPSDKHHITGKPTPVMRWLAKFVNPGGLILDPCAGSGSTGVGGLLEGRSFVGVEQDAHYARVASLRCTAAAQGSLLTPAQVARALAGRATEPAATVL